jgi:assimilatory nitrate reductase catalytic subunit
MSTSTTCPYCGVGCGVLGQTQSAILGDSSHPANLGKLCSKGSALGETLGLERRLLVPKIGGAEASWDEAINLVGRKFRAIIDQYGPDAVAFYVSGQILTEDYYLANKLMKGFIGSGNIDTNSRLCMASAVAAHNLAFGEDVVPGCYEDLELADLIVFAGHNAAWTHPVLHRRMEAQLERGQHHIVIDPRRTDTAQSAHLHLQLRPQTDVRLWNGLAAFILEQGRADHAYIKAHTDGLDSLTRALSADDQSIAAVAHDCDLNPSDVTTFYTRFLQTSRTVTLFSQGSNQSAQGVNNGLAVINAHLLTGRVSKPGASPFSITGQPNAMGGRETGGMATTLAAHLTFNEADRATAARFWGVESVAPKAGLKAVDMFDAIASGQIKAVWVMATNPVLSLPNANKVEAALKACEFVVVSEVIENTETARLAHVLLPALAWGEKDGTVTNSERVISRQRAFMLAPGQARADWAIVRDVAQAMGYTQGFEHQNAADVFTEFAAMTNFENSGGRALKLGALAELSTAQYDALAPTQWPVCDKDTTARPFAHGRFSHIDGRARVIGVLPKGPARATDSTFPLALNTGRLRDQWHTMTRTGLSSRLMAHAPEPVVDIHPSQAHAHDLTDGDLCRVETEFGSAILKTRICGDQRADDIFVPMHFSDAFAPQARANRLTNPNFDAISGQPEFKHTPARIGPVDVIWRGFLATQNRLDPNDQIWWARTPEPNGNLYEMSAHSDAPSLKDYSQTLKAHFPNSELIEMSDSRVRFIRLAILVDGQLVAVFVATQSKGLPQRAWLLDQLGQAPDEATRSQLLQGGMVGHEGAKSRDPVICACFGVTLPQIEAFAALQPDGDVRTLGQALKAGTNCGSCRTQIASILKGFKPEIDVEVDRVSS